MINQDHPELSEQQKEFLITFANIVSIIVKSDEEVKQEEMEIVNNMVSNIFQREYLKSFMKKCIVQSMIKKCTLSDEINKIKKIINTPEDTVVLLHFLLSIIGADGTFNDNELSAVQDVMSQLGLNENIYKTCNNVFFRSDSSISKAKSIIQELAPNTPEITQIYTDLFKKYYTPDTLKFGDEINQFLESTLTKIS